LARDTAGLVIINRKTDEQKIFYTDRLIVHSPYISRDGERLLFVQRTADQEEQELVSCQTSNWHCEVLQKTKATIISPVELDSETILYSSSPLVSVDSGKRTTSPYHNLYRLKKGSAPVQFTTFDAFQLDPISVGGDRVLFSALRGHSDKQYIPARPPEASTSSDIFSAEISAPDYPIVLPNAPFEPLFLIGGYSTNASIAADGRHVAFLNRRRTSGETRFNLVIASGTGAVIRYIDARGFGFSRPVFVDETIMANELLQDHYEVRQFSASGQESESAIQIKLAVDSLKSLPRVRLSLTNTK
jgi:hypothetical protein